MKRLQNLFNELTNRKLGFKSIKNNINRDNRLINLLILCQSCHCKQHYNSSTKLFNSTGCGTPT